MRASFPEARRKATLRPRGLFDFVSPFTVSLAALGYLLFVGYVIYIDRDPFSGFAGAFVNIGIVTALYASMGLCVYVTLFGKKGNPLQTQADRMRSIEVVVRLCVYTCLGSVVFLSLNFTLVLLDLQRWEPFAQAAFNVAWALLLLAGINAPPDELNLDALRVGPAPSNAAIRGGAHAAGSSPGSAGP